MYKVDFLRTENLRNDLISFLKSFDYSIDELNSIPSIKFLPEDKGFKNEPNIDAYYSEGLKKIVKQKERLLFEIFPEYEIPT